MSAATDMISCYYDAPLGRLFLSEEDGALRNIYLPGSFPAEFTLGQTETLSKAARALDAFFQGEPLPEDLPLAPAGTPFQLAVWEALKTIPRGETRTYGHIARQIGRPKAVRAVGQACNRNPIPLLIPCHRVVGVKGLTGFAGGLELKRQLLVWEGIIIK